MRWLALALALGLAACATTPPPAPGDDCARWFAELDAAVDAAGVRDAQDERIEGFAGLRADRLLVALREGAAKDATAFADWLARAGELDGRAREAEVANLMPAADGDATLRRADACRARWPERLHGDAGARAALLARARVPERYATAQRVLGLYPLLRWPFLAGVQAAQREQAQAIARWAEAPPPLRVAHAPPDDDASPLAAHAPVFEIETRAGFDRFGAPSWRDGPAAPSIDATQPVVYSRLAHTLYRGRLLTQLVYTLWFPERPRSGPLDLLAGALDGVIVRLTLAPDGTPLVLDAIHACGCWHLFFTAEGVAARAHDAPDEEGAWVAGRLPRPAPGQRLVVRLASATHAVMGLAVYDGAASARYALRDENELRSLPRPDGTRRSLYGPDGLVAGSQRRERFLFWPMGIASAGAMRQWGHHATAFVGRRHFDDADLIERRFALPDNDFKVFSPGRPQ